MKYVGHVLLGSNNYLLNGPDSDKDYKVFLTPTFDDLYNSHKVEQKDLAGYDKQHYSPMDVRKFNSLVLAGNVNCTEYLFSSELKLNASFMPYFNLAREFYQKGYLACVWDKWFTSLEGLVKNSFDRYGENRKTVSRAYFFRSLAVEVVKSNFCMTDATWRENDWNHTVRKMRFNDNMWLPSRAELENSLALVKKEGSERAKKCLESVRYHKLVADSEELTKNMKLFVRSQIYDC